MSEIKNIHDSETESDASKYFSELFTEEHLQYEFIRFLEGISQLRNPMCRGV